MHFFGLNAGENVSIFVFINKILTFLCLIIIILKNKAPANLALYMDGNEIAKVTANAPDKVVDLLDWYTGSHNPNDLFGSSFKLVWPTSNDTEAHLTRITISYTEPGN